MSELAGLVNRKLTLYTTLEFGDIIHGIDEKDAVDLVKAIDLAQEDADFTIKLIESLFASLRVDLCRDEGKEVIKSLKKINKSFTV